jgi:acetyl esterase/lipase
VLIYPVIDFSISYRVVSAVFGHDPFPSEQMLKNMSTHLSVNSDTPPAFIAHSTMDKLVPIENSIIYVDALRRCNVSVEFHSKDFGPHGFGMYVIGINE